MKCNGCSSLSTVFVLLPVYRCTKARSPREEKDKTPKMVADPEAGGYALYNISGVPAYGDARGAGIRNILGFVLMRSISYIFYMLLWTSSLPSLSP